MDFEQDFWDLIKPDITFANRHAAAEQAWSNSPPEKRQAMTAWLRKRGAYPKRNPYFFIIDFRMPAEEPTNMNGRALKEGVRYVSALYNGQWGMYTEEDVKKFNLKTTKK